MYILKKDLDKVEKKVASICRMGPNGYLDFYKYVDELVNLEKYSIMEELMVSKWNMDYRIFPTVEVFKKTGFDLIRAFYPPMELINIKKIYDNYNVYQTGFNIYHENIKIGQIYEEEIVDWEEYYQDREFLGKIKKIYVYLKAIKNNQELYLTSRETSIESKYDEAIQFLLQE